MEEVTEEQFKAYVSLQEEGTYNMLDSMVREICDLTREEHAAIIINYDELKKKYVKK
jgi:hypothetical protein